MNPARPEYPIFKVRILILIYAILCVLTYLFSRNFFIEILDHGQVPDRLNLIVFYTIPAVLLIFLGILFFQLLMDFIHKRSGSRLNARLIGYFAVIVIFSVAPITLMTNAAISEIIRFWHSIDASAATRSANSFIADNYSMHMERFENIIRQNDFSSGFLRRRLPQDIVSVQIFQLEDSSAEASPYSETSGSGNDPVNIRNNPEWTESSFAGDEQFRLPVPPSVENGFTARALPRDSGTIRYVQRMSQNRVSVISYNLGSDFDTGRAALENQNIRFESINELRSNLTPLLIYYYVVFFLPTLLMTAIISISFTRRITHPIIELTEATNRVAGGNFSIQILTRRNDELGTLIKSFNTMVQDLDESRALLLKNEKISIWQNMAQQLAHEVKNPLTPIKLSAERVLRRWQNDRENIGEILESSMMAIIKETEGLSILLNEFRTLSKPAETADLLIRSEKSNVKEPVDEAVNVYSSSYPSVKFDTEYIQADVYVKIDKYRLFQIITNVIINAVDAMDGSGLMEIRTDLVKKREIGYCRISFKDSGKGISIQENQSIFNPYFTTKESGTGLGLPIVERIVSDHGGTIWFDTAEGIGTTFYIDLPLFEHSSGSS